MATIELTLSSGDVHKLLWKGLLAEGFQPEVGWSRVELNIEVVQNHPVTTEPYAVLTGGRVRLAVPAMAGSSKSTEDTPDNRSQS